MMSGPPGGILNCIIITCQPMTSMNNMGQTQTLGKVSDKLCCVNVYSV